METEYVPGVASWTLTDTERELVVRALHLYACARDRVTPSDRDEAERARVLKDQIARGEKL